MNRTRPLIEDKWRFITVAYLGEVHSISQKKQGDVECWTNGPIDGIQFLQPTNVALQPLGYKLSPDISNGLTKSRVPFNN